MMKITYEKIPNPKELEKEISNFLSKKFGNNIKIVSPEILPQETILDSPAGKEKKKTKLIFDLKPEDLIAHLDQYIIKQDSAKAVLSTKICTHFNRITQSQSDKGSFDDIVGGIKNNVLMIGPTGVGKTYMIKIIAKKIGVPFVKGDATKFSETGYVGGDVEDLVRDLVREAEDDIELAECGIIYIDEIDKIASSHHLMGADVSRTGVQRALLKPLEETEVDLKVPHDPISMIQEVERFRKSGKRDKRVVNTKNILFIMSGAFADLAPIVKKRTSDQGIGFGAKLSNPDDQTDLLKYATADDLAQFGFESEFVGRLPVKAYFERLTEDDLFDILNNPNNPVILSKKLDFAAYGIDVKFEDQALRLLARDAFSENTGARGLVSAIERALLLFERRLPSTTIKTFPVTTHVIETPEAALSAMMASADAGKDNEDFQRLARQEQATIRAYLESNKVSLSRKFGITFRPTRIDLIAEYYSQHITDVGTAINRIKLFYGEIKKVELSFFEHHDINIVLQEDAADYLVRKLALASVDYDAFYSTFSTKFGPGLKLVRDKIGTHRFLITQEALVDPEAFISDLLKDQFSEPATTTQKDSPT
ncbi:MAG: AAA family ATPase [Desulfobacterales bacterium]